MPWWKEKGRKPLEYPTTKEGIILVVTGILAHHVQVF